MQFEYYKNLLSVTNYRQIKELKSDLILLEKMKVTGDKLQILKVDKERIVIEGLIKQIEIGET